MKTQERLRITRGLSTQVVKVAETIKLHGTFHGEGFSLVSAAKWVVPLGTKLHRYEIDRA
jgi:hypothetical protein